MPEDHTLLHHGFDGLDFAYNGFVTERVAAVLEVARNQASDKMESKLVVFIGVPLLIADSGSRGGYRYRADTGPVGANWFF